MLIEKGANVDAVNEYNNSALIFAVLYGKILKAYIFFIFSFFQEKPSYVQRMLISAELAAVTVYLKIDGVGRIERQHVFAVI